MLTGGGVIIHREKGWLRNVVALTKCPGKFLGPFKFGGRGRWAKGGNVARVQLVNQSQNQWHFRPNNHQISRHRRRVIANGINVIGRNVNQFAIRRHARIAGGNHQLLGQR